MFRALWGENSLTKSSTIWGNSQPAVWSLYNLPSNVSTQPTHKHHQLPTPYTPYITWVFIGAHIPLLKRSNKGPISPAAPNSPPSALASSAKLFRSAIRSMRSASTWRHFLRQKLDRKKSKMWRLETFKKGHGRIYNVSTNRNNRSWTI